MKKVFYIVLFTLLGAMVATIVHAVIEAPTLWLITSDIERYGQSFVWQNWEVLHRLVGGVIWLLGLAIGAFAGFRCWRLVYVEQRRGKPRF